MSLKVCTAEYMISDTNGLGMSRAWFPRVVVEAFLGSTKDGEIQRAPDPVIMIEGDLSWFNNSADDQVVAVQVHRAPRSVTTTNPNTVVLHDAWSYDIGVSPTADAPSVMQDAFGGRLQVDRASVAADDLQFGRLFIDGDDCQTYVAVGTVPSMQALHFRYLCAVQTPGTWTTPAENGRFEAQARWARLVALASPVGAA
ncbi:hypothetical protein SEA_NHAGOS_30 [Gordonia phage NHagos]|nr:hypothetical protein SEA_NHAGOS_30 [Gordonia phage NHagos]